ncbi:MAG: HAD family hydrolase [Alphaproteobacteria bacterium]|nr:HAD family hydrolase [Alphaproteobacteria bacterium]
MTAGLVIFDCDGVLIDSEPIVNRAHAETLNASGFTVGEVDLLARFCGMSDKDMLATLEREHHRSLPPDYRDRVAAVVAREYRISLKAMDGVAEVLAQLDLPFCVASSSVPAQIRLGLEVTGLINFFGDRLFSATMVARGKPAPDLFLYAAEQMRAAPRTCVVVEDSLPGVTAAVAAGMVAIGFTGGDHCLPGHGTRLRGVGAALVVEHMSQLPAAFVSLL